MSPKDGAQRSTEVCVANLSNSMVNHPNSQLVQLGGGIDKRVNTGSRKTHEKGVAKVQAEVYVVDTP